MEEATGKIKDLNKKKPPEDHKKEMLEGLLNNKSQRLVIKANIQGKNKTMWSQFDIAYLDSVKQQFACCKNCKCFIKYSGRTGTAGLMRHRCYKLFSSFKDDTESKEKMLAKGSMRVAEHEKMSLRLQLETLIYENSPRIGFLTNSKGKSGVWSQFQMITLDNKTVNFACCMKCRSIVTYISRTGTGSMTRHRCQSNNSYGRQEQNFQAKAFECSSPKKRKILETKQSDESLGESKACLNLSGKIKISEENEKEKSQETHLIPNIAHNLTEKNERKIENGKTVVSGNELCEAERLVHTNRLKFYQKFFSLLNMFENEEFLDFAQSLIDLGATCGRVDARELFSKKLDLLQFLKI